jgi:hypothetical protein
MIELRQDSEYNSDLNSCPLEQSRTVISDDLLRNTNAIEIEKPHNALIFLLSKCGRSVEESIFLPITADSTSDTIREDIERMMPKYSCDEGDDSVFAAMIHAKGFY